jgi:hypothetical protein
MFRETSGQVLDAGISGAGLSNFNSDAQRGFSQWVEELRLDGFSGAEDGG